MDDELSELVRQELDRHTKSLADQPTVANARAIAHSMKGALGLVGAREPSEAFGRIERRLVAGDPRAQADLGELLGRLRSLLAEGRPLPASTWPLPPADLRAGLDESPHRAEYLAAVRDRLAKIDAALSTSRDEEAARAVFREVHTIKGAALAVGDDVMAWFCHGLEERLRSVADPPAARRALEEVDTYRGVLAEIVDEPEHALETLRLMSGTLRPSRPPLRTPLPLPPRRPAVEVPSDSESRALGDAETVRVSIGVLEGLLERAGQLGQLRAPLSSGAVHLRRAGDGARGIERGIREALRMIGPPRPWGAPAAALSTLERCAAELAPLSERVDAASTQMTTLSRRLSREGEMLGATVQSLRTTPAAPHLERLAASARGEASRLGKVVEVVIAGGEKPIDRRILDGLIDPLRQIVRNAVAHGVEAPAARRAAHKAAGGTLRISVSQRAGLLTIAVEDDGAGVDDADVRQRAVERGLVTRAEADELDPRGALSLLFYPGFSLRSEADLLAGRGVGLDLALAAVQRLGGTIQLENAPGRGLAVSIVVPAEAAPVRVLWLECGGDPFGLPVQHVGRIARRADWPGPAASLATLLGGAQGARAEPFVVEVRASPDGPSAGVLVEGVGAIEEVTLRALPLMLRAIGPFGAAIVWADELRLSLDPIQIVSQASRPPSLA
jgi:two-component system chemotaxis sensor kinase CheA